MIGSSFFAKLFQSQTLELDRLITGQNPEYYNQILNKNTFGPDQITKILQPKETQVPPGQLKQLEQPNGNGNGNQPATPATPATPNQPQQQQNQQPQLQIPIN